MYGYTKSFSKIAKLLPVATPVWASSGCSDGATVAGLWCIGSGSDRPHGGGYRKPCAVRPVGALHHGSAVPDFDLTSEISALLRKPSALTSSRKLELVRAAPTETRL